MTAERDIVQFMAFQECLDKGAFAASYAAEQVLAEIPNQVLTFLEQKGIKPNPPKH
jgi:hypothetical protein